MTSSHRQKAVSSAGSRRADAGDSPPNLEAASSAAAATSAAPPPEAAASRAAAAAASAARKGSGGGAPSTAWALDAAMGDLGRMTRSCFGALRLVGAAPVLQPAHTFPPGTAPLMLPNEGAIDDCCEETMLQADCRRRTTVHIAPVQRGVGIPKAAAAWRAEEAPGGGALPVAGNHHRC